MNKNTPSPDFHKYVSGIIDTYQSLIDSGLTKDVAKNATLVAIASLILSSNK